MLTNLPVLVLNQNYQPLNISNLRRAVVLLDRGKAELMENGRGEIHSATRSFPVPSVIRLVHMVKRPMVQRKLSRRAVFYRDRYTCQYCGNQTKALTLDHIVPRSQGGRHAWGNVASACVPCNHRKAGLTPSQARMKLLREPGVPRPDPFYLFHGRTILAEWRQFMPWVD